MKETNKWFYNTFYWNIQILAFVLRYVYTLCGVIFVNTIQLFIYLIVFSQMVKC